MRVQIDVCQSRLLAFDLLTRLITVARPLRIYTAFRKIGGENWNTPASVSQGKTRNACVRVSVHCL